MVLAGQLLADRALHETRQRRQNVDGRVDLSVVELAINEDLALRDVACQVRDRVGDICRRVTLSGDVHTAAGMKFTVVRHGQDGNLCDGAIAALDTTRTLIDGRQVRVHVARVSATTWHLLASCGDLAFNEDQLLKRSDR
jgi:hypothetical protein